MSICKCATIHSRALSCMRWVGMRRHTRTHPRARTHASTHPRTRTHARTHTHKHRHTKIVLHGVLTGYSRGTRSTYVRDLLVLRRCDEQADAREDIHGRRRFLQAFLLSGPSPPRRTPAWVHSHLAPYLPTCGKQADARTHARMPVIRLHVLRLGKAFPHMPAPPWADPFPLIGPGVPT